MFPTSYSDGVGLGDGQVDTRRCKLIFSLKSGRINWLVVFLLLRSWVSCLE